MKFKNFSNKPKFSFNKFDFLKSKTKTFAYTTIKYNKFPLVVFSVVITCSVVSLAVVVSYS